jgi:hypothetical protein
MQAFKRSSRHLFNETARWGRDDVAEIGSVASSSKQRVASKRDTLQLWQTLSTKVLIDTVT